MAVTNGHVTIGLSSLPVGIILPGDVVDTKNSKLLLISQGTPVTQQLLDRLKARGVKYVSLDEQSAAMVRGTQPETHYTPRRQNQPAAPVKQIEKLQRPVTEMPAPSVKKEISVARQTAVSHLKELFASAKMNGTMNGALAKQAIADSVDHMMVDIDVYLKVALQTVESNDVHEHCLAAAQLAMSVGVTDGLIQQEILDLGIGCVLSRIGQSDVATQSAEQERELTKIEFLDLKRTPSRTFDFLQNLRDVPVGARNVAYQIFERMDGSGYPRGRSGNQISFLSRIAAVCDVYVALTSPRPYRAAHESYAAIEILLKETKSGKFDPLAMRALLKTIGLFPIGSYVKLSDGSIGQVVRNHSQTYDRPVVHLYFDAFLSHIQQHEKTIDLAAQDDLKINSAVCGSIVQELLFESVYSDQPMLAGIADE